MLFSLKMSHHLSENGCDSRLEHTINVCRRLMFRQTVEFGEAAIENKFNWRTFLKIYQTVRSYIQWKTSFHTLCNYLLFKQNET